ncbi:MAG: peptidylprolyl isomerase [Clostridia bacterium]|jgi:peptidyl-prolyl cis-trans isomerase B (cyclophilin B)|nr:peptidylprolyl isomerase [Clostridia bacterium]
MKVIKAEIEFTVGKTIRLDLYPELAPISVKNFVELAQSGYYEGLIFHRVIPAFMIQGGGFSYENGLRPAREVKPIKGEFRSNGVANVISHEPGVISMARTSVKDSASSQFFICVADAKFLDGEYAAFGKVSDQASLDVAVSISRVKTHSEGPFDDIPDVPVVIKAVRITEGA